MSYHSSSNEGGRPGYIERVADDILYDNRKNRYIVVKNISDKKVRKIERNPIIKQKIDIQTRAGKSVIVEEVETFDTAHAISCLINELLTVC